MDESFEVVRNLKTGKLFILVDESEAGNFKVINDAGDLLELPPQLFDEEPVLLEGPEAKAQLTDAQIARYRKVDEQLSAWADRQAMAKAQELQSKKDAALRPEAPRRPASGSRRPKKKPERAGPPETRTWASSKLTFYRHYIEPMRGKDRMRIDLGPKGVFECSKDQFLSVFNDVILDSKFRSEGIFTYDQLPEKAVPYIASRQENM